VWGFCPRNDYPFTVYKTWGGVCKLNYSFGEITLNANIVYFTTYDAITSPYTGSSRVIIAGYDSGNHTLTLQLICINPWEFTAVVVFTDAYPGDPNFRITYESSNLAVISYKKQDGSTVFRRILFSYASIAESSNSYFPYNFPTGDVSAIKWLNYDLWFLHLTGQTVLKTRISAYSQTVYSGNGDFRRLLPSYSDLLGGVVLSGWNYTDGYLFTQLTSGGGMAAYLETTVQDWIISGNGKVFFVRSFYDAIHCRKSVIDYSSNVKQISNPNDRPTGAYPRIYYDAENDKIYVAGYDSVFEVIMSREENNMLDLSAPLTLSLSLTKRRP
jgi:hypothetical protein